MKQQLLDDIFGEEEEEKGNHKIQIQRAYPQLDRFNSPLNLYPGAHNNLIKKPNPLSRQHDMFRRHIDVFDKEQIFERLLKSKEEMADIKEQNVKLKTRLNVLEKQKGKLEDALLDSKPQSQMSMIKLIQEHQRLLKDYEEKQQELSDLKKKDRVNRCQELEMELSCYIEETARMRCIVIQLSLENGRLRESLIQNGGLQKSMNQTQSAFKNQSEKMSRLKGEIKELKESLERLGEEVIKVESERERLRMQNTILKQRSVVKREQASTCDNKPSGEKAEHEKALLQRVIERQRKQIANMKQQQQQQQQQQQSIIPTNNVLKECPLDIQLIVYGLKSAMVRNQYQIRQLGGLFQNERDPFDDKLSKQQLKNGFRMWPFKLGNESKLIRLIEWLCNEQSHMDRNKFLVRLERLMQPYMLGYKGEWINEINQVIENERERIVRLYNQKQQNGYINIVQVKSIWDELPLSGEQKVILEHSLMDRCLELDKVGVEVLIEQIVVNEPRSKSSCETKRNKQVGIGKNLKYRPDYHFRRYGATAQVSFIEFYDTTRLSRTFLRDTNTSR